MSKSIDELGKYGLIEHLTSGFKKFHKSTIAGPGDDSAIISGGKENCLVSTDLTLEGIHFNLVYTPLKHLGYKAVIRAISDIYAMNGKPEQLMVSVGISSRFKTSDLDELYEGIRFACEKYSVDLAGGDTSSSLTGLAISVTAIGRIEPGKEIKRSGAANNDLVCVTGDLGSAYMGLQLLERERKIFEDAGGPTPDLSGWEYIVGRQLKPELPLDILSKMAEKGIKPTSMIDITEGLASDLMQICKASGKGCRIYQEKIPIDRETASMAEELGLDPLIPALNGGEDYELLFTVPLDQFDRINEISEIKTIGHILSDEYGMFLVSQAGEEIELFAQGWRS